MSDLVGLGATDAAGRWIGVRRHQAVLVVVGFVLIGDFIVRRRSSIAEVAAGVWLVAMAVPTVDGLTCAEMVAVTVSFLTRPKWLRLRHRVEAGDVVIDARGTVRVRGYELRHRGRLDLSGRAERDVVALGQFVDALAVGDDDRHVSIHVITRDGVTATLLSSPPDARPPQVWGPNNELILRVADVAHDPASWCLERWGYVRGSRGVSSVLRIRDFAGAGSRASLLERIQLACDGTDVVVHIDIVGAHRAARLSARAVHRQGSDDASSAAAGFRRSARSSRASERTRQREILVAEGRALLRLSVFLVVHATSIVELRGRVDVVRRRCADAGLQCERGMGRQSLWFTLQLPGGPGW